MTELEQIKEFTRELMPAIIDGVTQTVRYHSVQDLDGRLRGFGFRLIRRDSYGPASPDGGTRGRQLFYRRDRVLVRLKTEGDPQGFRQGKAHLSAALNDGGGLDWMNDQAKFTAEGEIQPKIITTSDRYSETDFQGNPQKWVVILGGKHPHPPGETIQSWADRTHFPCPAGFSDVGVDGLSVSGG